MLSNLKQTRNTLLLDNFSNQALQLEPTFVKLKMQKAKLTSSIR